MQLGRLALTLLIPRSQIRNQTDLSQKALYDKERNNNCLASKERAIAFVWRRCVSKGTTCVSGAQSLIYKSCCRCLNSLQTSHLQSQPNTRSITAPDHQSCLSSFLSLVRAIDATTQPLTVMSNNKTASISYFRNLLEEETRKLNTLCSEWEKILARTAQTPDLLDENNSGQIRSAIGLAHLLVDQRFKQFSGLIKNCEEMTSPKVTPDDLQGFWDMVSYQVEDIYIRFKELSPLKKELALHNN